MKYDKSKKADYFQSNFSINGGLGHITVTVIALGKLQVDYSPRGSQVLVPVGVEDIRRRDSLRRGSVRRISVVQINPNVPAFVGNPEKHRISHPKVSLVSNCFAGSNLMVSGARQPDIKGVGINPHDIPRTVNPTCTVFLPSDTTCLHSGEFLHAGSE